MVDKMYFFSSEQGNVLIRLIIAHLLSDFMFQSKKIVENKKWFSKEMFFHCTIIYISTALISGWWIGAFIITIIHYIIDGIKIKLLGRYPSWLLFILDQLLHVFTIILVWGLTYHVFDKIIETTKLLFNDYNFSLIVMAYIIITTPLGYLIKFILNSISDKDEQTTSQEKGGVLIGVFERIIILTFVLLGKYEAIGFLITGKSIIRFANKNEHIKSEYVLVGTMLSYCLSILIGVVLIYLMK